MSTVKRIVNILLSFILAVLLTVLTLAGTLQFTLLNENFILDNMNTCNYITEKKDEITSSLTDLGYASGLEEDFFSDLLNEVMLHDDVEKYLSDYYSGRGSVIDKTAFKQTFNTALDKYIEKKGIDQIIAMMAQRDLGVAVFFGIGVERTPAQARTQRAHGLALGDHPRHHRIRVLLDDVVFDAD